MPARFVRVSGVVQGVGFRPFVYRLAAEHGVAGWVLNGEDGVEIHAEGDEPALDRFVSALAGSPPPAARIAAVESREAPPEGFTDFAIRHSAAGGAPTVRIAPDLPMCDACRRELFDPTDRRAGYPYINCTDCGPRYSIVLGLPYDRPQTTMRDWPLCPACAAEYEDPLDRRFHAQPVACPRCGPGYRFHVGREQGPRNGDGRQIDDLEGGAAIAAAAAALAAGEIVAVKGLGGYHLACDARDAAVVSALRQRKYRKEKPFALMVPDVARARELMALTPQGEELLGSPARPIVLAPAHDELPGVAPGNRDLGVMLPYTPLHELLFAAGAPDVLVMTSANRSSEPIAYRDREALERLGGLADGFLIGARPIARRVDDSVVRLGATGPAILRRARGYAPGAVTRIPLAGPWLALGADLKSAVTLVVAGDAFVSQHLGDLQQFEAFQAFRETVADLLRMYEINPSTVGVVHDLHPEYASTRHAEELAGPTRAVQHHRAHVASVLAERQAWDQVVVAAAFDGTGYGDDGTVWGGELFAGSVLGGLDRVGHLRPVPLPGGDAAARHPVQAAAGFLAGLGDLADLTAAPFHFPDRFAQASQLVDRGVRTYTTTSAGRLFDTVAAIAGFTREMSFEGQAAIWLEQLARRGQGSRAYEVPFRDRELDHRPALAAALEDRRAGVAPERIAAAFHRGLAAGLAAALGELCETHGTGVVVLSGGVFQNQLLLELLAGRLRSARLRVWTNREVPANDGGISLGQAALALGRSGEQSRVGSPSELAVSTQISSRGDRP